jgi:Ribbon-helix-helix protein, copG family
MRVHLESSEARNRAAWKLAAADVPPSFHPTHILNDVVFHCHTFL